MNYQYNIGCSLSNLKGIRDFIRHALKDMRVSEVTINEIVLAIDEMCSNLMIHAHQCNPDHQLELHVNMTAKDHLLFEILDDGSMFDINQFSAPELDSLVHEKRKGGLGIRLVKTIMDKVEYVHEGKRNICRMTKRVG